MVGAMDPYWGSSHCVHTLIVPLLTQMYKLGTGYVLLLFFLTLVPNALEPSKPPPPLKGPRQPHLCFCLYTRGWLLCFIRSMSKQRKSL